MRSLKNLEKLGSIPTDKIIQEIQPNKTCTCGACEPNAYAEASAQEQKAKTPKRNAKA